MAGLVEQVVTVESPVHFDEVVARIRDAWGLRRAGGRIQDAVLYASQVAVRDGRIVRTSSILSLPGAKPVLRDRSEAASLGLRKPETIPPAEIAAGLLDVVTANLGATDDEAVQAVARGLGFKATSAHLRATILEVASSLLAEGAILRHGGLLRVQEQAADEADPQAVLTGSSG